MSVKILDKVPVSGQYPEKQFGPSSYPGYWVEFEDNHYEKWLGYFYCSCGGTFSQSTTDSRNETAFVVLSGQGYLVDILSRELLYQTDNNMPIENILHTVRPEYFLAAASFPHSCIYIFNEKGLVKKIIPENFISGITFQNQQGVQVIGKVSSYLTDDFEVQFELNLDTLEVRLLDDVKVKSFWGFESITKTPKRTQPRKKDCG